MRKKGGLGRGLGALIPRSPAQQEEADQPQSEPAASADAPVEAAPQPVAAPIDATLSSQQAGLIEVQVDHIAPNPRQPRQEMRPEELDELAASIREHGILQPLVVTYGEEGRYHLIAGERRWRAAILAGHTVVPAIVKEATSREMLELALVENLQRADLNPLEEAHAYQSLLEEFGLRQEDISARVGKSRQAVANALRLLRLPHVVQESLTLGLISEGHARAILQAPGEEEQIRLMEATVAEDLSVRQVEALARRLAERPARKSQVVEKQQEPLYKEVEALEEQFRTALGTKVQLSRSRRGGKLVIYFYSDEELDRIYGTIVGEE
jgi:ParB family chromosome partitioning protein